VLAGELTDIAERIEADGWIIGSGRVIDRLRELEALSSMAADVERYGEQPVAARLAEAVRLLSRPRPWQPLTAEEWVRRTLWKRKYLWPRNYGPPRAATRE
jgi:hypothetical protein